MSTPSSPKTLPVLDIMPLLGFISDQSDPSGYRKIDQESGPADDQVKLQTAVDAVVLDLYRACTDVGFFYINTPFPDKLPSLIATMESHSHLFFDKSLDLKKRIDMTTVGSAWRGFFSVGDEFTSGAPDIKEGIYFGSELPPTDQRVIDGLPMHGANVFPRTGDVDGEYDASSEAKNESYRFLETTEDGILRAAVLEYLNYSKLIGFAIIDGLSLALGLDRYVLRNILFTDCTKEGLGEDGKHVDLTKISQSSLNSLKNSEQYDPLCLFRIFNYPATKSYQAQYDQLGYITPTSPTIAPQVPQDQPETTTPQTKRTIYSVAEHTDYGAITILYQDNSGGLQVRDIKSSEFIPAPPLENTLVINIGDSLEKMTNGLFVSTPHRVSNQRQGDRISFPFFFDPSFQAGLVSLVPIAPKLGKVFGEGTGGTFIHNTSYKRWDGKEIGLQGFNGTYGNYILEKVSKVFPQLAQQVDLQVE